MEQGNFGVWPLLGNRRAWPPAGQALKAEQKKDLS
jgi:hypothetical protein